MPTPSNLTPAQRVAHHTPGPWSIPDGGITPAIYSADGDRIATLDNCGDEAEANALLIAAAPDMLAALRLYDEAMAEAWRDISECPPNTARGRCWRAARAAIAKAEG